MTLAQDLKSLKSAYKNSPEASAAIGDTIDIIEKHLTKIVAQPAFKKFLPNRSTRRSDG